MNQDSNTATNTPQDVNKRHVWKKVLKITAWSVMGIVLFIVGILMGVVGILTPERLTPLTERIATNSLQNARVEIDRVELTIVKTFPFVHAKIDNLVVLSTVRSTMSDDELEMIDLPSFADTVMEVRGFEGGLNVLKLFANQLDLSDVTITHPSANLVVIDEDRTNFDIIPPSEDTEPLTWDDVPGITLRHFTIVDPGVIRYYDAQTMTDVSASFTQVDLTGTEAPLYTLNFDGEIMAPSEFLEIFNIPDLKFGLNGNLRWDRNNPTRLAIENFDFLFSVIGGHIDADLDFADGLTINRMDLRLNPLDIHQLQTMLPEDIAEEFGIPGADQLNTDAKLDIALTTQTPWHIGPTLPQLTLDMSLSPCYIEGMGITASDFAPSVTVNVTNPIDFWHGDIGGINIDIKVPACPIKWQEMDLKEFALDASVNIPDWNPESWSVTVRELRMQGPATDLTIQGTLLDPMGQQHFDGSVQGHTNLSKLPAAVRNMIDGTLSGDLTAHVRFRGSPSMFNATDFHRLAINGDMVVKNLYWVSGDTVNMVQVDRVAFDFGTHRSIAKADETTADSLLSASLTIDSARIVHSDLIMSLRDFKVGLASENRASSGRAHGVKGMGGGLSLGAFNLTKLSDSAVVRIRDVRGYTSIKPYNGDIHVPEFVFDLNIGRLATGDRENRVIIGNAHTRFNARRVAKSRSARQFTQIADSIYHAHPELSPDSVMYYALQIHNRRRSKYPRVHPEYMTSDSLEIMDWGASPMFKRLLSLWTLEGQLTSDRAGLFTPYLPLRNRFRHIDITFNNDSVNINNLEYKIGHSDFLVNGVVSNMRRAFTSTTGRSPLKIHFEVLSDTVDVNQLTDVVMAGSAYSALPKAEHNFNLNSIDGDEDAMERKLAESTQNAPDSVMPLLIPANIDAEVSMKASTVCYSDFVLRNMSGRILAYNGALNLDNLSAASDVGSLNISALYSGLRPDDLRFGFGLQLKDFNLDRFLNLVPAIDSIAPVMRDLSGIITADIAATADVDQEMNLVLPSLDAAIGIKGDSLVLIDPDTFKSLSKWLMFKDKKRNIIDHMDVQMTVANSQLEVYPFIFDIDRYKLGVQGYNDFDMNFDYHIAVLKSPLPFKFGINLKGNPDDFKIRLGGAKFGEKQIRQVSIVDTTRVNLMKEIKGVFRRGARDARLARLRVDTKPLAASIDLSVDTLTHADSLRFIQEGLIEAPADTVTASGNKRKSKKADTAPGTAVRQSGIGVLIVALTGLFVGARRRRKLKQKNSQIPDNESN